MDFPQFLPRPAGDNASVNIVSVGWAPGPDSAASPGPGAGAPPPPSPASSAWTWVDKQRASGAFWAGGGPKKTTKMVMNGDLMVIIGDLPSDND